MTRTVLTLLAAIAAGAPILADHPDEPAPIELDRTLRIVNRATPGLVRSPIEGTKVATRTDDRSPETALPIFLASNAQNITITGHLYYNDRRENGRFEWREDRSGDPGEKCGRDGLRSDGSDCARNWLGAYYTVVDIYERDRGFLPTDWNCTRSEHLGSATVGHDGRFSVTLSVNDPCNNDEWSLPALALRARLRFCNSDLYCFSMNESKNDEYALYLAGASWDDPMLVSSGMDYTLNDAFFYPAGNDPEIAENYAIAANYYATLVDSVLTWHRDNEVPFYYDEYGEVQYIYPSNQTASATTKSADKVVVKQASGWVKGEVIAHEYGHLLNLRAWQDENYGWGGSGISTGALAWAEPRLAFKEGWANFASRAVHEPGYGCTERFDENDEGRLGGLPGEGDHYSRNVTKLLCDWWDQRRDDDGGLEGDGDYFYADLYSIWYNLRRMWLDSEEYGGDREAGLDLCDYLDYYLNVRKSGSEVGASAHDDYVLWIADLALQNRVGCGLGRPDDSTGSDDEPFDDPSGWTMTPTPCPIDGCTELEPRIDPPDLPSDPADPIWS